MLDLTLLSRANFDVTRLDAMSPELKQRAIERLSLPVTDIRRMPPTRFRTLSEQAVARARAELMR